MKSGPKLPLFSPSASTGEVNALSTKKINHAEMIEFEEIYVHWPQPTTEAETRMKRRTRLVINWAENFTQKTDKCKNPAGEPGMVVEEPGRKVRLEGK